MRKKLGKLLSLTIALSMVITSLSGCGEKKTDGDSDTGKTTNDANVYVENGIEFLVDPEQYKGTTVTYCTWRDPEKNEDGTAIKAFEEKYGINVEVELLNENKYVSTIASSIAAGTQGDVFFQNHTFPASLSVMQPLDAAKINYEDPIWRKEIFEASTLDGHAYLVDAVSNIWTEIDICVYNKSLFEDNGITSPEEYYEAGNWTFETFEKACRDIASLGSDYIGGSFTSTETILGAAGCSFFTYKDNQLSVTADSKLYDVMHWLSQLKSEGIFAQASTSKFAAGKVGVMITDCFALKRSGYFPNMNPEDLAVTYTPKYDANSPQIGSHGVRGWGLIKGAKNPEAAGIFLREYLDVNNYDLEETFHNEDVSDFFFKVTNHDFDERLYYYTQGVQTANGVTETTARWESVNNSWAHQTPSQIKSYLDSQIPVLNSWCSTANDIISDARKYISENYS